MSYRYDQRRRPQRQNSKESERTAAPGPGMEALMSGRAAPSAAQKGRSFDLDAAMKAKMENAFGDLSAVKFYESRAVGEAGAEAIARGNEIAFAPGMADFSTKAGQERLGHELSHVMSQRSGAVRGSGFLNSPALEARADREGAMAAAGQQVYTGPVAHALSDAGPSAMVSGAIQAKRQTEEEKTADRLMEIKAGLLSDEDSVTKDDKGFYDYHTMNVNLGVVQALSRGKRKNEKEMLAARKSMQGENENQLDMRASLGKDSTEASIRDAVLLAMQMNLDSLDDQDQVMNAYKPQTEEEMETAARATKLMDDGASNIKNPYYQTEEGKAEFKKLHAEKAEYMRTMYKKAKKKWWQFWK